MPTVAQILVWSAGVQFPEGDSGKCRAIAADWQEIATRLDNSLITLDGYENKVLLSNFGPAVKAFQRHYATNLRPYVPQVSSYCRHLSTTVDEFADNLSQAQRAMAIIATNMWFNMIFTTWYGFGTGYAMALAEKVMLRLQAQAQAALWNKTVGMLIQKIGAKRVENMVVYPAIDSVFYAGGQQFLQRGTFEVGERVAGVNNSTMMSYTGFDPTSFGTDLKQFKEGFVSNLAFDYSLAGTDKIPYLNRGHSRWGDPTTWKGRAAGLGGRMIASNVYSYVNNLQTGSDPVEAIPTAEAEYNKLWVHVPRMFIFPRGTRGGGGGGGGGSAP